MLSSVKERMLRRVARDIEPAWFVNLGIGYPLEVVNHLPEGFPVTLHAENGMAGVGPELPLPEADRNLIDAGGLYVSRLKGSAFFDSATSFALVRSGRVDLTLLGAFEVAQNGDLANWAIPGKFTPGAGGAIELAQKAKRVGVITTHQDKRGNSKICKACTLPLTARGVVTRVYTDMAVMDVEENTLFLRELAEGVSLEDFFQATEAEVQVNKEELKRFS